MDLQSLDLKEFVDSLDLTVGLFRILKIEATGDPKVLTVFSNMVPTESMPKELVAELEDSEMAMAMWVMWVPDQHLMRFSCNLDLGMDSINGERLEILIGAVNYLNFAGFLRVAKVFVHADENEKNIGTAAFTLSIPPNAFETAESTQILRNIVSENMARLYREAATITVELHAAIKNALTQESEEVGESNRPLN